MKFSSPLLLSTVLALFFCSTFVNSYSIKLPHGKAGILGQEELGPIDNYTCTEEGLFPDEDCEYFITCWSRRAVLWKCTDEMLYSLTYNGCDFAENVDCGERRRPPDFPGTRTPPTTSTTTDPSAPTSTSGPTTPPPNSTFECTENGAHPHPERCEYYFDCWEGTATMYHCQLDYLFDLTYMGCNFPEMVDCGSRQRPPDSTTVRPPPTTTTRTTTSQGTDGPTGVTGTTGNPGEDFECPSPNGMFPDPKDCGAFYTCLANTPIRGVCPPGLHFNPKTSECDYPEVVGCSTH